MNHLYKKIRQAIYAPAGLLFVLAFLLMAAPAFSQTPYPLASGNYAENFDDLANWTADFGVGTGAGHFGKAAPQPTLPNANTVFSTNAINPDWGTYRTSVDAIEAASGLDLLSNLPLEVQAIVEAGVDQGPSM